jgi:hypothetical protein
MGVSSLRHRYFIFCGILALAGSLHFASLRADADEPKRDMETIAQKFQRLKLFRQHEDLLSQGIANEVVTLRSGAYAIRISPRGNSRQNKIASKLLKSEDVSIYISPERTQSANGVFSFDDKSIYLSDLHGLFDDFDTFLHEVRHSKFKGKIAPGENDTFHGRIIRKFPLMAPGGSSYVQNEMFLEENFTFPYQLRVTEKAAFTKPGKTDTLIKIGTEINQFTTETLTELLHELQADPSKTTIAMMDASLMGGPAGKDIAAYFISGKNFNLVGFIGSVHQDEPKEKLIDALKQSLQMKIEYYTRAGEAWKNVRASFNTRNTEDFSRDVRQLISGAREQLQPKSPVGCMTHHIQALTQ